MYKFILPALLLFAGVGTSCLSEQVDLSPDSGNFQVLATDLNDDDVWALNRSITLTFNNPIDPDSVGFHSVVIRPLDNNQVSGQPVTGMFELLADGYGNADQAIRFWPACASHSESGGDGGLIAGGVDYELLLPTSSDASAVLRDTAGHPLSLGLRRTFRTPIPPAEETYLDLALGPLHILAVDFPERLNLFTEGEPSDVVVTFDQDLEPGISNLNSDSLWLEYTLDAAFGSSPDETKRVPVRYFLLGNCAPTAVQVVMRPLGILPPDALFRVVMAPTLRDLSGETNSLFSFSAESRSESLLDLYNTTAPVGDESMVDEFMDNFLDTSHIDLSATLYAPQASPRDGAMHASMSFPGEAVAQDKNFWLGNNEVKYIDTDGVKTVTDSNQEVFPVNDGVLYLNNLTIEAGATLRGQGSNPLQIYVVGDIFVYGTIDVSGDPAPSTVTGNRPDQPEYGASGQCGGGAGGSASLDISQETFFGENGFSPFGLTLSQGGQGGEGGYQRYDQLATPSTSNLLVGGGGGGAFAGGPNEAVFFAGWFGALNPDTFDNAGPDLNSQRHTAFLHNDARSFAMFQGAEQGLRGAGGLLDIGPMGGAGGTYGMELGDRMQDPADDDDTWDPAWTSADPTPPFELGHPTDGPDGGAGGVDYASAEDCFFGRQFIYLLDEQSGQAVQSVKDGALLTPWAGAGGGASGDSHTVIRKDLDGDTVLDDVGNFWPDPEFPTGTTGDYYKGAPGGGGGGQLLLMSLGGIVFGESSSLLACGGSGAGGESTSDGPGLGTTTQISGSGGGSGGHIVLHSSTGIDFSAIPLAGLGNWADPDNFLADASASSFALRAIGGRRGWAFSSANSDLIGGKDGYDGNGTYQAGRGGAGGNGVIQIHVPNPLTDIIYHPSVEVDINNYLTAGDPTAPFAFTDR
ncbi:MAG: hypothetical protein HOM34_03625, partial [Planctomycetes bacterium]|nr:hypothetical protein [Planctomycetota bacterium]